MRRRTGHAVFAGVALACAALAAYQALRLVQAHNVNKAIEEPSIAGRLKSGLDTSGNPSNTVGSPIPEAQFAHAIELAHTGDPDAAFKAYKTITQGTRPDLRVAALYNIGNLHMREAARKGADDPTQLLPLVELAKQSYRDVLREQPTNWDARYNLERALQLAPEVEDVPVEEEETEAPEEHVSSTLQGAKMDLP